ncbi:MAG: hypothetical protein IK111_08295 [Lachnospiraceae bacterium]|nr:hypothetical protein [Lachnospiraceae bacterium]
MEGIRYMKAFEIIDEESRIPVGVLMYYEAEGAYIIELNDMLDEWSAPLLFTGYIKQGLYTIPRNISAMWVRERVIPSSRQNISNILANHKLRSYDEMKLLELSHGRCAQDSLYIRKLDELPGYVRERMTRNIKECIVSPGGYIICFFADETVKRITLSDIEDVEGADKVTGNRELFMSGKVGIGGYSVVFNDSIDIPAHVLYGRGADLPLKLDDFITFVKDNILDTTECCKTLDCSRQNLSYMVGKNQLHPVKEGVKGNLYLKGDVLTL